MSSTKKPTIILLPGAWHEPFHYTLLTTALQSKGFTVKSEKLPSVNPIDPSSTTLETEATFVRETLIQPELSAGNDVILLAHSYGGVVAGAAAKGLSRQERGEGKSAVLGWVFMCALVGFTGKMMVPTKGDLAPWIVLHEDEGVCTVPDPLSCVYTHVPDQEAVNKLLEKAKTQKHSWTSFHSESPPQAWEDGYWEGRRAYVRCELDQAVSVNVQDFLVQSTGVKWEVESIADAGHSPFMSHVPLLTDIIEKYAKQWA